jgi:hypothetical protein
MTSTTTVRRGWGRNLLDRWPTALALLMTAATYGGSDSAEGVRSLANALVLLQLGYVVVAKLQRRQASWPVIVAGFALIIGLRVLDVISPAAVLAAIALVVLIWGAVDGQLRRSAPLRVQALGMVGFGVLALGGLVVNPDLGRWLVAAGFLLHGVWDFVYFRLDRVVARSHAEWCAVLDVIIAVEVAFKL